jgi:hypothetical protein
VLANLATARTAVRCAAVTAEGHDLLVQQLGELLATLNTLSTTYLGQQMTGHPAIAAPHTHP